MPDGVGNEFDSLLNALNLSENLGLVDVAILRNDSDHSEISAAENLLQKVGCLDVDVFLRRPQIGIGIHLQFAHPGNEERRDRQDRYADEQAV